MDFPTQQIGWKRRWVNMREINIEDLGARWFDFEGFSMDVIAWKPLPSPYQPEGKVQDD